MRERELNLGVAQREIRKGMSQADVAEVLGSPNIVTRDKAEKETWIYDKIATEASYSHSGQAESVGVQGGVGVGALVSPVLILSGVGAGYAKGGVSAAGAASTTQRTLTVVIKFDDQGLVDSFSYHASKFSHRGRAPVGPGPGVETRPPAKGGTSLEFTGQRRS